MRARPMMLFKRFNLGEGFRSYLGIHPALGEHSRDDVFAIRHEVYCEELGFEPVRPERRETDEYDTHSLHCLMKTSGENARLVGCNRIVLARPGDPHYPLPFERTCEATLDRSIIDPAKLPRDSIAEVSRLAVRAAFRRRAGDSKTAVSINREDFGTKDQPRFPYIPVGLYLGAVHMAERSGIETMFVLTEPRLAAHFGKLGVKIRQIGGPVEHRGLRIPSMLDVKSIIKGLRWLVRPIWNTVVEDMEAGYQQPRANADRDL